MKPRILVTRELPGPGLALLENHFEVTLHKGPRPLDKNELIEMIKDKEALLCLLSDSIDADVFTAAKNLKVISNYAVGFNNIDLQEANRQKIPVCNTPGILTEATADLTWALILATTRRIVEADTYTREGHFKGWEPSLFLGYELSGKTLGIIGMGRIGEAVAKRAHGFNMNVIYTSRSPKTIEHAKSVSLKTLLQEADVISLHAPLTSETYHLISTKEFHLMKDTAFLINTTRGPIVDEKALLVALTEKQILGAGLDVYEEEPSITQGLTKCQNLILLPHIGSATVETRAKMSRIAAENAIAFFTSSQPHAVVNPEVLT